MLYYIKEIINVEPYTITCRFNTDEIRHINLEAKLNEYASKAPSLFGKLLDSDYFKTVKLDSYGTISWDNDVDFCPDVLYEMSEEN